VSSLPFFLTMMQIFYFSCSFQAVLALIWLLQILILLVLFSDLLRPMVLYFPFIFPLFQICVFHVLRIYQGISMSLAFFAKNKIAFKGLDFILYSHSVFFFTHLNNRKTISGPVLDSTSAPFGLIPGPMLLLGLTDYH